MNGTECQWNVDVAIYGHPEGIAGVLTARPLKNFVELQAYSFVRRMFMTNLAENKKK